MPSTSVVGYADRGLIRAAAGAAICAAQPHRLARAAGCGENHAFAHPHERFSGRRWPLGPYGDRFAIF